MMKTILMRALNLLTILAGITWMVWLYDVATKTFKNVPDDELYVGGVLIIAIAALNYVLFGKLTVWHKQDKDN